MDMTGSSILLCSISASVGVENCVNLKLILQNSVLDYHQLALSLIFLLPESAASFHFHSPQTQKQWNTIVHTFMPLIQPPCQIGQPYLTCPHGKGLMEMSCWLERHTFIS